MVFFLLCVAVLILPIASTGQEVNRDGWPVPDLKGLVPYSIRVDQVDGVEKIVEKFYTPNGGLVAKISGNGRVFAYAVDCVSEPPIAYIILVPDRAGLFTQKFLQEDCIKFPEWVSR